MTKDSLMSSYATGWIGLIGPCRRVSGKDPLGSGCFCFSKSSGLSDNGRIPFDILFVNSFKVPLTLPLLIRTLNFLDILEMFLVLSGAFKWSCIVYFSLNVERMNVWKGIFTSYFFTSTKKPPLAKPLHDIDEAAKVFVQYFVVFQDDFVKRPCDADLKFCS